MYLWMIFKFWKTTFTFIEQEKKSSTSQQFLNQHAKKFTENIKQLKETTRKKKTICWLYYLGMLQKKTLIKVYHMFVTKEEFQLHVYDSNVFIQNIQVLLFNSGQNVLRGGDSWELIKIFFFQIHVYFQNRKWGFWAGSTIKDIGTLPLTGQED